jgi:predicted nucleic acid-binding protein
MNAVFLDSSFVIALLNRSDPHHEKAKSLAADLAKNRRPRLTTTAVLLELGDGFARKGKWDLIAPFLFAAEKDPLPEIVSVDFATISGATLFRNGRPDKDWGLTDCISFIIMENRQLDEALTADHHFQQAGFRALLFEP